MQRIYISETTFSIWIYKNLERRA